MGISVHMLMGGVIVKHKGFNNHYAEERISLCNHRRHDHLLVWMCETLHGKHCQKATAISHELLLRQSND